MKHQDSQIMSAGLEPGGALRPRWKIQSVMLVQALLLALMGLGVFLLPATGSALDLQTWQETIKQTHPAKAGCFQASYPDMQWQQVFCDQSQKNMAAPPQPPTGTNALTAQSTSISGGISGNVADAVGGPIRAAEASFLSVTGVSSIRDSRVLLANDPIGNTYSLQINTEFFIIPGNSSLCDFSTGCQGWVQFTYQNMAGMGKGTLSIWYFVTRSTPSCQAGWGISSGGYWCIYQHDINIPLQPISSFNDQLNISGQTLNGIDTVTLTIGGRAYSTSTESRIKELPQLWQRAQFDVFGRSDGSKAIFNDRSALIINTKIDNGTTNAPNCSTMMVTAESNNLYYNSPCCAYAGGKPSIVFAESTEDNPDKYTCADFGNNTITPVITSTGGGTISPSAALEVPNRAVSTFTITPDDNYKIGSVTGCGGSLSGDDPFVGAVFTTQPATTNCTVTASFIFDPSFHKVTASAGPGGTISPSTPVAVKSGTTTQFTVKPDPGYAINTVTGCNGTLNGNTYTTAPITARCTVSATFSTITVSTRAGPGGTISPSSARVAPGATTWFTVRPDAGYYIASISGCGGTAVTGDTTYTTDRSYLTGTITANCTVSATFTQLPAGTTYKVSTSAGLGGTITPSSVMAAPGKSYTFDVKSNDGYYISFIYGCGGMMISDASGSSGYTVQNYTTGAITQACTVTAQFVQVTGYTVSGTVNGLSGELLLDFWDSTNGRSRTVTLTENGRFKLNPPVQPGSNWTVSIWRQPIDQICTVTGGSGSNISANVTNVNVTCTTTPQPCSTAAVASSTAACAWPNLATPYDSGIIVNHRGVYWIKIAPTTTGIWAFTVSTAATNTLYYAQGTLLQSDGTTEITNGRSTQSGPFRLSASLTAGQTYYLMVTGGTTDFVTGNFTVTATAPSTCCTVSTNPGPGGTINPPSVKVNSGEKTTLTVKPNPNYYIAAINGCNGSPFTGSITNITERAYATGSITGDCTVSATFAPVPGSYTVGGTLSGLSGSVTLNLTSTNPTASPQTRTLTTNGSYTFPTPLQAGSNWTVSVTGQPANQKCTVANSSGTDIRAPVTNVNVTCSGTITYTVSANPGPGGTISPPSVKVNLGEKTTLTVKPNPNYYIAAISGCNGAPFTGSATNTTERAYATGSITGDCTVSATFAPVRGGYTVGGTISGLNGSVTLALIATNPDSSQTRTLTANGSYTFTTPLLSGSYWTARIATQPTNQTCIVTDGWGNNIGANVTNVNVTCTDNQAGTFTGGAVSIRGFVSSLGYTLIATPDGFSPNPGNYTFQWLRNGANIPGATVRTYTIVAADAWQQISVRVTASKAGLADKTVTAPAVTISGNHFTGGTVSISGIASVGNTLSASASGFSPTPDSYTYDWVRSGVIMSTTSGPNISYYRLSETDAGRQISVRVTVQKAGYIDAAVTSPVVTVSSGPITGTGGTVTSSVGSGSGSGSITPLGATTVNSGATASYTLTPGAGYMISWVGGTCGGTLSGNIYTTRPITANCTVVANFTR